MVSSPTPQRLHMRERYAAWCDQNHTTGPAKAWFAAPNDEAKDRIGDAIFVTEENLVGPHCQAGPSPYVTAKIILGGNAYDIAKGKLTRAEAHKWANQTDHETPKAWLWADVQARHPELKDSNTDSLAVARWIDAIMKDPPRRAAALKKREGVMGDQIVGGRPIDRLDELKAGDLRGSPVDSIEIAAARIAAEEWDGPDELTPEQDWHKELPPGVVVLRHYSTLRREGAEMRHCASAYAQEVADGVCIMVSVEAKGARSTAEIRGEAVTQHKGPRNEKPHESCVELLSKCRWR